MAKTIETNKGGNDFKNQNKKNWFGLGIIKSVIQTGPRTEKRLKDILELSSNEKVLKKVGKGRMDDIIGLTENSESNAKYAAALFYYYITKGEEFITENLHQYLKAFNNGEDRKFINELVGEIKKSGISGEEIKYVEEFVKLAFLKNDEQARLYAGHEILDYIDRRNKAKDAKYDEIEAFKQKIEFLRDW
jgi:hypothetical protein